MHTCRAQLAALQHITAVLFKVYTGRLILWGHSSGYQECSRIVPSRPSAELGSISSSHLQMLQHLSGCISQVSHPRTVSPRQDKKQHRISRVPSYAELCCSLRKLFFFLISFQFLQRNFMAFCIFFFDGASEEVTSLAFQVVLLEDATAFVFYSRISDVIYWFKKSISLLKPKAEQKVSASTP